MEGHSTTRLGYVSTSPLYIDSFPYIFYKKKEKIWEQIGVILGGQKWRSSYASIMFLALGICSSCQKFGLGSELDYVLYSCFTNHRIMKQPETVYLLFLGVEQLFYSSST